MAYSKNREDMKEMFTVLDVLKLTDVRSKLLEFLGDKGYKSIVFVNKQSV